jgi:hypothetical protein
MATDRGDPWKKAAACEAHAQASNDGKMQGLFRKLRDSWIRIGNNQQFEKDVEANAMRLNSTEKRGG